MVIIAVANQKGGVGKTTTTVNLGAYMARVGKRVLIVDLDPQGNASSGLGIDKQNLNHSLYDVLVDAVPLASVTHKTKYKNLSIIPASAVLAAAEVELTKIDQRESRLKQALTNAPYDIVLIDCPPSLNLLTLNAMSSAHAVLVPVQCEFFALEGISQLKETIDQIRGTLNPRLEIQGVVLTMHDARTHLSREVADNVRAFFGPKVYETMIPRNTRVAEAPSHGKPILLYDYDCAGSQAYIRLATEIIERERRYKAA